MGFEFKLEEHKLEPQEEEAFDFVQEQRKATHLYAVGGDPGQTPTKALRAAALEVFEKRLIHAILKRVELEADTACYLTVYKTLKTCIVAYKLEAS